MSGREKDRKLRRRRQRKRKLKKYKSRLKTTKNMSEQKVFIEKIKKISIYDQKVIPKN